MTQGISLHIGVDKLNPQDYPLRTYSSEKYVIRSDDGETVDVKGDLQICWIGPLKSCEKDADDMFKIAQQQGFTAERLKGPDAKIDDVKKKIEEAAEKLSEGDIFLLSYAGHGNQVKDKNKDERRALKTDKFDETWCLFDGMIVDDEQQVLYAKFREGVRIFVLSDSCHSGTVVRGPRVLEERSGDEKLETRGGPNVRGSSMDVYYERQEFYDAKQVEAPEVKASVILISACQDDQLAGDGDENGKFTRALKEVWKDWKEGDGGYEKFANLITKKLEMEKQTPNFLPSEKAKAGFVDEEPFKI